MKMKYTIALLTLIGVVGSTQAAWQGRAHWVGGGAAGDYYDAANWIMEAGDAAGANAVPANVPGLEYDMFLDNGGSTALSQDTLVNVASLGGVAWAGKAPTDVTLTINNANVETIWWFVMGEQFGASGTINMNGGSLTVGTDLMLGAHNGGSGTLNMTAGTVTAGQLFVAFDDGASDVSQQTGVLNLSGGTVNAGAFFMNAQGYVDISGNGKLVINGDVTGNINTWIGNGQIVGDGGAGTASASYDIGSDTTTVIPEPGTLGMVALMGGGLLWVRRKFMI